VTLLRLKRRRDLETLAGRSNEVFTLGPNRVVKQQLEFQLVADRCQVCGSTHFKGTPWSQLKPGPSPRRKRLFPNPTSAFTSMVVTGRFVSLAAVFRGVIAVTVFLIPLDSFIF
jgi:hypothetical protein